MDPGAAVGTGTGRRVRRVRHGRRCLRLAGMGLTTVGLAGQGQVRDQGRARTASGWLGGGRPGGFGGGRPGGSGGGRSGGGRARADLAAAARAAAAQGAAERVWHAQPNDVNECGRAGESAGPLFMLTGPILRRYVGTCRQVRIWQFCLPRRQNHRDSEAGETSILIRAACA